MRRSVIVAALLLGGLTLVSADWASASEEGTRQGKSALNEAGALVRTAQREHQECMFAGIRRIGLRATDVRAAAEVIVFDCQRQAEAFRAAMVEEGYRGDWLGGFFENVEGRMQRVVMGIILDEQAKAARR